MTNQLREVVAFLLGETELDGVWFGEPHPSGKPYWWRDRLSKATLPTQSAGVEERAHVFSDYSDHCRRCGSINIGGKCTPASEGDGGRVVEWQIMRPAFVTADENYSGKRVAAVYADASMIGQRVRLIFDTTPPTQQEARAVDGWRAAHMGDVFEAMDALRNGEPWAKVWNELDSKAFRNPMPALQPGAPK